MTTKTFKCRLLDGSVITVPGVTRVEKDGSGRRFYGEDEQVICAFDDGQSTSHWLADAEITPPPAPEESEVTPPEV